MVRAVLVWVMSMTMAISPAFCCCTVRLFVPESEGGPAKKSCCHCDPASSPAPPQSPKPSEPCKCKALKIVMATGDDHGTFTVAPEPSCWPLLLHIALSTSLSCDFASIDSHHEPATPPAISGMILSSQIAVAARLTC